MKPISFILGFLAVSAVVHAQPTKHLIFLSNKKDNPYTLSNPSAYLSAKAINRRTRFGIAIDSTDLPVNPAYLDSIIGSGDVQVLNTSRWLNYVLIHTTDTDALAKIQQFSFVKKLQTASPRLRGSQRLKDKLIGKTQPAKKTQKIQGEGDYFNYGSNYAQVNIHEGTFLHNKGLRGEGMTIAVLDAGFYHYDTNPAFDSIVNNHQVLGTWDFVDNKATVTEEHDHGMVCFSTIAANSPGKIVGTAPKAKYYLFRTEDVYSEYQVEEQNWVAAAERADSLGVDLITSSLGYYNFDDAAQNYAYNDMDGKTAIITRGAEYAFKKGMIVTNSAGNSGGDPWHYIIAPADGAHVLAVGAVNTSGEVAWFSSYGPSADGRIKPDVASVGVNTVMAGYDGNPVTGNGTSLANPNMAGLVTCLWQAFPEFSNQEIIDAVRKSSNKFNAPDDRVGYGIPNMRIAYQLLDAKRNQNTIDRILANGWIKAYPVPFTAGLTILVNPSTTGQATIQVFNEAGSLVFTKSNISINNGVPQYIQLENLNYWPVGVYWVKYTDGKNKTILRVAK